MTHADLGAADPEELAPLLGSAYAVALLLPPPLLTGDGYPPEHRAEGAQAALWLAAGVDPAYVAGWLEGEAQRLRESIAAPVAPGDIIRGEQPPAPVPLADVMDASEVTEGTRLLMPSGQVYVVALRIPGDAAGLLRLTPGGALCPECTAGKHPNCDGTAWSDTLDAQVPCECREPAHL